ncbi:MAG: protease pro-enzyme activation domain-containing protein [Terracidiphilus sp.]|jgi:subtilase family serine protease
MKGQAKLQGQLSSTQTLKLAIALPLRNQAQLDELLQNIYDPQSPSYHQWLSMQEFTDRFGPTEEDYDAVARFAEVNGMTVTAKSPNRMVIDIEGSVSDINKTFHVTMGVYKHPTEDRTFYAPNREPSVDLAVQLWHIAGLDDFSPPQPHLRFAQPGEVHTFTTGSGPSGTFLGSDIRAAYYGGTALTGAGQTIGLYGLDYNISDVELYYSTIGQSFNSNSVQNYSTDGTTNSCGSGCDDGEPVIDIYESLSMAPSATVIEYFGNSDVDTFNAMASANVAKQLSASVGWLPSDPSSDEPIFKEFAAQGQNLFVASDDSGAYSSSTPVYYPADDPYVTAAGGTDLTTNGAGGSWASESAWVGSGGGISTNGFAIPSYQQLSGVINSSNKGSTTLRNVPDVAAEANTDNYYCANGGCAEGVGGTSLAAPRWAGFLALINEQAANNSKPSVGFLNPTIYAIGTGSSYDSEFHDITAGNNGDGSGNSYSAVVGYDLATGWGSPNGQGLINALAGATSSSGGYNVYGIYTDDTSFTTGGLDNDGSAYSSNLLGSSLSWNGTTFAFGAANSPDAYSSATITLPSGKYSTLNLLATGVNGNQTAQTFTVTYTDGTTTAITQSLSDWYTPQSYSGESTALIMAHRDTSSGTEDNRTFNLYGYSFAINSSKIVQSLTLPNNRNVVVLAVVPILNGAHTLIPQNASGMVLDDWASGTESGNQIDIWPANGTGAQSWVFNNSGVTPAGYYNIAVSYGPYCVTASGSTSGSLVNLQPCIGSSAQAWEAVPSGDAFVLHPANNTSLCLDVQGDGTAAGTLVQGWTCNGGNNEEWVIN